MVGDHLDYDSGHYCYHFVGRYNSEYCRSREGAGRLRRPKTARDLCGVFQLEMAFQLSGGRD
ncbi:hypothetical protein D3C73_1339680 [compost metagenome]